MRKFVFAILMGLLLASCEQRPIRGYVVGKQFAPAHNITEYNVVLKMPLTRRVPDQWIVWVADSCCVRRCHVDKPTFNRMKHGQFVTSKGTYYGKEED